MKKHYDFTDAVQGLFTVKEEDIRVPHYLSFPVERALRNYAIDHGKTANEVIESLLIKELGITDAQP